MKFLKVNWVKQSIQLLKHELKRGELTIIVLAIVLGVASVFSLAGFSGKIKQALLHESTSFIAADRVLQSSRELVSHSSIEQPNSLSREKINNKSQQLNIKQAEKVLMSSMVFAGDVMALVEIQAVSTAYPLRGELLVSDRVDSAKLTAVNAPDLGSVYIEEKLLSLLGVTIGDVVDIGEGSFTIKAIAKQIPDASFSVFTSGVKIIINLADLDKTQLVQPGSRLTYKYLFSGEIEDVQALTMWLKPQLNDSQRWHDIQSKQSPLANALNRAEKYLSLASLLGIILAAVAVSVASRRYAQRHHSSVGVYKAMGASLNYIKKLYYLHWSLLSLFSILMGLLVGYILAQLGFYAIQDYLPVQLTVGSQDDTHNFGLVSLGFYPLVIGAFTGVLCSFAFAITPLKELTLTSPLVVIRGSEHKESNQKLSQRVRQFLIPLLALIFLLFIFSGDLLLSFSLLIGGLAVSALLLFIGHSLMKITRNLGTKAGASWHLALANLQRRAKENSVQLVSFTIAIKLLLMIIVIKSALLTEWQAQLPEQTPNLFLVNMTQNQASQVEEFARQEQITAGDIYAVVLGRLTAINDDNLTKKVTKEKTEGSDNGRQGVGRELNLTWRENLPKENTIVEGQWWQKGSLTANQPQVSIEQTLAKRLNIKIGDNLTFQLGSEVINVPVTSIRKVNWQSMQPNFYMIFHPQVLADYPASYISSIFLPADKKQKLQQFLGAYPTIIVIDVDEMILQLRKVIEQVSTAVEFILVLVVFAGCLVLVAQVQASMEEREREIAILKTIGAKGSLLRNSILLEFVALGGIAGLMASFAMELTVYLLQSYLFNMQTSFHFEYWLLGIFSGATFVGVVGLLSCWRLLNMSSVTLIRRTM